MRLWMFGSEEDRAQPEAEAAGRILAELVILARAYLKAQFKKPDNPTPSFPRYGRR